MFKTRCGIMTVTVMSESLSGCILRETFCETIDKIYGLELNKEEE